MTFERYRCWEPSQLSARLQTEADISADHVFLATHTDFLVGKLSRAAGPLSQWPTTFVSPREVLESFLANTGANLTRAVVLGDSGSGKSHLIHWLKLRIPTVQNRHVVTVPRSGINLRMVIEQLIALLPEESAGRYQEDLRRSAFSDRTLEQRVQVLMDCIAQSFGSDVRLGRESMAGQEERALLEGLPDLFHDPRYRSYLAAQPILRDLVNHIGEGRTEYVPTAGRLEFAREDLPLRAVQAQYMSKDAQDILSLLQDEPELLTLAVELINRNLDTAIGTAINFGGARLGELMKEVRSELARHGQELVLLVEDLALLQGIDSALIDALLVQPGPGEQLCAMRWAMAVTTDYYDRAPDTLKTRVDLVIDMDRRATEEGRQFGEEDLVPFAARYLNATRLTDELLGTWAGSISADDEMSPPPNACLSCIHRDDCHAGFGSVDGIGLYPFRREALVNMARRKGVISDGRFNPRLFMEAVLLEVLGEGHKMDRGDFPPASLRTAMSGPSVDPLVRQRLHRDYSLQAERLETVLTLWSANALAPEGTMPAAIWQAFGLPVPQLGDLGMAVTLPLSRPGLVQPNAGGQSDLPLPPLVAAVRAWAGGQVLRSAHTNHLREALFRAVVGAIDWDSEGLLRAYFAQATDGQWFRQTSINFDGQELPGQQRQVQLQIPGPGLSRDNAGLALEALLMMDTQGPLLPPSVPGRGEKLAALTVALEIWSRQVLAAIRGQFGPNGSDRFVASAVETLALAVVLSGVDLPTDESSAEWLEVMFKELPTAPPEVHRGTLQELYRQVRPGAVEARELLRALCTSSKGGDRGSVIDGARVLPALKRITRAWLRGESLVGLGAIEALTKVREAHERLGGENGALEQAASREMNERISAIARIRAELPSDQQLQPLLAAVIDLHREAIAAAVLPHGLVATRFEAALANVQGRQGRALQAALAEADDLARHSAPLPRLPTLARIDRAQALHAVHELIIAAKELQTEVATVVNRQSADLGGGQRLSRVIEEATIELHHVCSLIARLEE